MFTFNIIGLVIMFIVFAIEISLTIWHNHDIQLNKDIKTNMLLGILLMSVGAFSKSMALAVYSFLFHHAIFEFKNIWLLWFAGYIGCEFCHYFYHWLGHKTRLFWASHVTHHSSEFFNTSTGFRVNFIHIFYRFLFWSPLCWLGITPEIVLLMESLFGIHNFIVHTEKVGKLGWLDIVFNTPSSHRVHHGKNPKFLDKNFGGITLIFDHLFGTYASETELPVYGITHGIPSNDPVTVILNEYREIGAALPGIRGFKARIKYLFSPPS